MAPPGQGKMANLVGSRMRVIMADSREMVGEMLAFDKHMNLVLADTEEFRIIKRKNKSSAPGASDGGITETKEKRPLGLTIVRGAHIITLTVEAGPQSDPSARLGVPSAGGPSSVLTAGPGISKPVGRGLPIGLQGPAPGMGGAVPPMGFPSFPGGPPGGAPSGFPGVAPVGFGRGGPPGEMPPGFPGAPPMPAGLPPGFQPPPGFQGPPGQGRGFPPGGFPPGR